MRWWKRSACMVHADEHACENQQHTWMGLASVSKWMISKASLTMRVARSFLPLLRPGGGGRDEAKWRKHLVHQYRYTPAQIHTCMHSFSTHYQHITNTNTLQLTMKHECSHQSLGDGALCLPETALLPAPSCMGHIYLCLALDGNVILCVDKVCGSRATDWERCRLQ